MRKPLKEKKPPRRQRSSGVRPVLDDEEVTRIETPTARQKEEAALSEQVTLPRLPDDLDDSGEWASDEPDTVPDSANPDESLEPPPEEDEELTVRQRPGRLPRDARMTLPSRNDIDRRALPFAKPEGRRDQDEPLELAATVKAPSSESLELDAGAAEVRDEISSLPPSSDSPWSQHAEINRRALPSSMMPRPLPEPEDEEGIERARRATLILWIAVVAVAVITLAAMLWI